MDKLIDIFCDVDDFCHKFLPVWETELITDGVKKRRRQSKMSTSECMTIVIAFHQSNHRDFKNFYIGLVRKYWLEDFPNLLSYTRFLNRMSELIVPMCAYFQTVKENLRALLLSTPQALKFAITFVFLVTKSLMALLSEAKEPWVGFTALNCIY